MTTQRNVEGLRQNAQRKRQEALEKVEQGIRQLIKEGKTLNFNTVAQAADVSKAFLYKEPEIKERIEQLRLQGTKKAPELKQRASDASKDAIIRNLRERVKKLEAEVKDLRKQNEVAYGQILEVNSLRRQIEHFKTVDLDLGTVTRVTAKEALSTTEFDLQAKLKSLGVQLNTTIQRLIAERPEEVLQKAIESLAEARAKGRVDNPSGFFCKAVGDAWNPNENYEVALEQDIFNQWYPLAQKAGLVQAATLVEEVQSVLTVDGAWIPFEEILHKHPLEELIRVLLLQGTQKP